MSRETSAPMAARIEASRFWGETVLETVFLFFVVVGVEGDGFNLQRQRQCQWQP